MSHLLELSRSKKTNGVTCHKCGGKGHMSYDCASGKAKGSETFVAEVEGYGYAAEKANTWVVDSGATHHMCNTKENFKTVKENPSVSTIVVGNNSKLQVKEEGTVQMKFRVGKSCVEGNVAGVLYAPTMARNLFSVTQTMKQGKSVLFDAETMSCKIFKAKPSAMHLLKSAEVVGCAKLSGGLWVLESDQTSQASAFVSDGIDMELWHQRLGHLGENNLKRLQEKQMVKGLDKPFVGSVMGSCEGCKKGKQHREPFFSDEQKPREKLELVQSDIKGPINPVCFGGFKYFVTFLDVATRKCWVYLLKFKSEVPEIFKM